MKKNYSFILSVLIASILFLSCKKDETSPSAGNGGSAVFKLGGAPSGCTPATVAGLYESGTPLSPGNTVTVEVDVLAAGTYSFRTSSANGVYFTTSGSFSSTGSQTIVLTGVGTPVRAGAFVFATTNNSACTFNVDFSQGAGGGGGTAAVFTYAGAPGNCTGATPAGSYFNTVGLNASNYVDLSVNVTTIGTYNITTNSSKGISFSGAGVFASTGAQTLRLTGQGTPNATGAATFTPTGGCSFSLTIAAAPSPGAFTYNCATAPRVAGTYTAGTALNTTNTITIDVNVTSVGSYSVNTGSPINGVSFNTSGVFTTTGVQTIVLTGSGTPTAANTSSYTPSGTGGCAFSVTSTGGGGGGTDFLRSTINGGAVINFNEGLFAAYTPGTPPFPNAFIMSGDVNTTSNESLEIAILDDTNPVGVRTYTNINLTSITKGCTVSYTDAAGVEWTSAVLIANNFTVNITSFNTVTNIAIGNFSGRVYDDEFTNPTSFKTLNGSFSVTF